MSPNVVEDVVEQPLIQSRVYDLTEPLTERFRSNTFPSRGAGPRTGPNDGRSPSSDQDPPGAWDDGIRGYSGSRSGCSAAVRQRLQLCLRSRRYDEFRDELARAEIAEDLSEFDALNYQAILAVAEGSEFAGEYLEMADAVASSPYELAAIAETRAAHDLRQGNPVAAAERCLTTLEHVHQTEGLWIHLLIALSHLGEVETIDATLRRLTRLNDECTARLAGVLSSEPGLRDVHTRPAFQQLLAAAG